MILAMSTSIELRAVEQFPEPMFTDMVDRLLHEPDRALVSQRFFGQASVPATPTRAQQIRVGAFAGQRLVGWSHAFLQHGGTLCVSNSGVEPECRRQGIYTRLVAAMEEEARALGCIRIESHHRAANTAVLIAKLRLEYLIVGTEFSSEMGVLVKLSKQLRPGRAALFQARAGTVEAAARFFGAAAS
jgi:GNAT superfamily N-acetyltransferase